MTHDVDYPQFPSSLKVVWVFDTDANRDQVFANGQDKRMLELTTQALSEVDVHAKQVLANLHFDRSNAGDWQQHLACARLTRT